MFKQNEFTTFGISIECASVWFVAALGVFVVNMCATTCYAQESSPAKQEKSAHELRLEYASLSLKLAETELKLAEQFNRELEQSIPWTVTEIEREHILNMKRISKTSIERLKSNISIAKTQLALANSPSTGNPEKLQKRYAEEKIRLAKINLDAIKADKLRGKEVPDLQIVREDLKYRMAQVDLALLGNPEHLLTLVDSLQRQIDQLREGMMRQDQRITAVEDQGVYVDR